MLIGATRYSGADQRCRWGCWSTPLLREDWWEICLEVQVYIEIEFTIGNSQIEVSNRHGRFSIYDFVIRSTRGTMLVYKHCSTRTNYSRNLN